MQQRAQGLWQSGDVCREGGAPAELFDLTVFRFVAACSVSALTGGRSVRERIYKGGSPMRRNDYCNWATAQQELPLSRPQLSKWNF